MLKNLLLSTVLGAMFSVPAMAALPPAPNKKPPVTYTSRVVSTQDAAVFRLAVRAAREGDWRELRALEPQARDPGIANFILWLRATSEPGVSFDVLDSAVQRLADWPRMSAIIVRAEDAIEGSTLSAAQRISWLERHGPITGDGQVALGLAYLKTGQLEKGGAMIRDAWRGSSLTPARQRLILREHRDLLNQDDFRARADFLVWIGYYSEARGLKPYLTDDWDRLIDARVALARREGGVDNRVRAVPDGLQDHPGLMFERARWRRRAGMTDSVTELLLPIDGSKIPLAGRGRLWDERHLALRAALKDGDFSTSYSLATSHGLNSGVDFANAEWLAGWLALRRTNEADRALEHFLTLEEGVSTPISLSRARYWSGRALEARGEESSALAQFSSAAEYPFTYYGQLGAEKVGSVELAFPAVSQIDDETRTAFEGRQLIRVARLLGEAGDDQHFRTFVLFMDKHLDTDAEHELLFRLTEEYQMPHIGIRGAKQGLSRGLVAPDAAYPILGVQPLRPSKVEEALVMALSRQESELNTKAISRANARGLMQLLPSTARQQARLEGLPYRTSWLTDDPAYNITLGAAHLDDLLERFNGSYVLTIAAYNAGASRPDRWILEYGDPRRGLVDPIDWVETIPFSETRNYVQRVLENLQVYRQRLTGAPVDIRLSEDLKRGYPD